MLELESKQIATKNRDCGLQFSGEDQIPDLSSKCVCWQAHHRKIAAVHLRRATCAGKDSR